MKKYAVAFERLPAERRLNIITWLEENFGSSDRGRCWYLDQDYDLENLVMDEDIYMMYRLRW